MQRNEIYNRTTGKHGERIYTVSEIEAIVGICRKSAQTRIHDYWEGKRDAAALIEPPRSNNYRASRRKGSRPRGSSKTQGNEEWRKLGNTVREPDSESGVPTRWELENIPDRHPLPKPLPSASQLMRDTGISYRQAVERLIQYRGGTRTFEALFAPPRT